MRRVLSIACGILAVSLAGVCLAQKTTTAPAARPRPPVDHVKDLFDLYSQGDERTRFFDAAGVDGELSGKEFAAAGGKPKSFVRAYDRWEATVPFDANGSGKLSWAEAEKYRESIRKHVLAMFDKNKDGKLTGEERAAANLYLRGGMKMPVILRGPAPAPAGKAKEGQPAAPAPAGKAKEGQPAAPQPRPRARSGAVQGYDADGDGQISAKERQAMFRQMRETWELQRYDKNKDGALDDEEKAARDTERENWRRRAEEASKQWEALRAKNDSDGDGQLSAEERQAVVRQMRERWELQRYDKNKDGALDDEEKAARDTQRESRRKRIEEMRRRMGQQRRVLIRRWDTDGNGQLSDQERAAMGDQIRRRAQQRQKEMDADGDGKVSGEESRNYWQKLRQKYDADNNGSLDQQERQKMMQEQGAGWGGRGRGRRGARRTGASPPGGR